MKILKSNLVFLFVMIMALTFMSCNDDDNKNDNTAASAAFFARVNGTDFNPQFVTGFSQSIVNNILITGSMGNGEEVQLFIPIGVQAGTYDLGDPTEPYIAIYQKTDGAALDVAAFASSGNINISEHNVSTKFLTGNFSFSGTIQNTQETYDITEGTFELTYEVLN